MFKINIIIFFLKINLFGLYQVQLSPCYNKKNTTNYIIMCCSGKQKRKRKNRKIFNFLVFPFSDKSPFKFLSNYIGYYCFNQKEVFYSKKKRIFGFSKCNNSKQRKKKQEIQKLVKTYSYLAISKKRGKDLKVKYVFENSQKNYN